MYQDLSLLDSYSHVLPVRLSLYDASHCTLSSKWLSQSFQLTRLMNQNPVQEIVSFWFHPVQDGPAALAKFCDYYDINAELCSTIEKQGILQQLLPKQIIQVKLPSSRFARLQSRHGSTPTTRNQIDEVQVALLSFNISLHDYDRRSSLVKSYCRIIIDEKDEVVFGNLTTTLFANICYQTFKNKVEEMHMELFVDFLQSRDMALRRMNIWEGMTDDGSLTVVNPPAYLIPAYEAVERMTITTFEGANGQRDHTGINLQAIDCITGMGYTSALNEIYAPTNTSNISNQSQGKYVANEFQSDNCHTSGVNDCNLHIDHSNGSDQNDEKRADTSGSDKPSTAELPPSLHVLLSTHNRRPEIFGMLASLKSLDKRDHLTIVFDGLDDDNSSKKRRRNDDENDDTADNKQHSDGVVGDSHNSSSESGSESVNNNSDLLKDAFVRRVISYAYWILDCSVYVHVEFTPLGHWGHGVRNKYGPQLQLQGGDFVLHVDDDDMVLPGAIEEIKNTRRHANTLYLFRVKHSDRDSSMNNEIVGQKESENRAIGKSPFWHTPNVLKLRNIGTPCGVIPIAINTQGHWGLYYGGDFEFYASLIPHVKRVTFVDFFIYQITPAGGFVSVA